MMWSRSRSRPPTGQVTRQGTHPIVEIMSILVFLFPVPSHSWSIPIVLHGGLLYGSILETWGGGSGKKPRSWSRSFEIEIRIDRPADIGIGTRMDRYCRIIIIMHYTTTVYVGSPGQVRSGSRLWTLFGPLTLDDGPRPPPCSCGPAPAPGQDKARQDKATGCELGVWRFD